VDLAGLGGLEDQAALHADTLAHQVLMDRADREQRGDRRRAAASTPRSERISTL
jgi:hypothetical protein